MLATPCSAQPSEKEENIYFSRKRNRTYTRIRHPNIRCGSSDNNTHSSFLLLTYKFIARVDESLPYGYRASLNVFWGYWRNASYNLVSFIIPFRSSSFAQRKKQELLKMHSQNAIHRPPDFCFIYLQVSVCTIRLHLLKFFCTFVLLPRGFCCCWAVIFKLINWFFCFGTARHTWLWISCHLSKGTSFTSNTQKKKKVPT